MGIRVLPGNGLRINRLVCQMLGSAYRPQVSAGVLCSLMVLEEFSTTVIGIGKVMVSITFQRETFA